MRETCSSWATRAHGRLATIAAIFMTSAMLSTITGYSQAGALIAGNVYTMQMPEEETAVICSAIGNHDEGNGIR